MTAITHQKGIQMNETKTKYMINIQDGNKVKAIDLMGKKYEKVESFKYLESVMTSLNDTEIEVKSKIALGSTRYYALGPILKRRSISQSIKIRLYKMIIRPTVIYGTETWTVTSTSKTEKMLMTWEKKTLRKIYGPTKENRQW